EKSPERAVDALRVLCRTGVRAHLTMIGDGPLRSRLEERAAGLPVSFACHVSDRRRVAELVAGADVALSPSAAEAVGLATLGALACGVPAVVPGQGAARGLGGDGDAGRGTGGTPEGRAHGGRELLGLAATPRGAAGR